MNEQTASFAAGCFWGVEARFRDVPGVSDAVSGCNWPPVITQTTSNIFRVKMTIVVQTVMIVPMMEGIMMRKNICISVAPSTRDASRISSGIPFSAAEKSTMEKPVCSQITITIRNRLFQGAIAAHLSQG